MVDADGAAWLLMSNGSRVALPQAQPQSVPPSGGVTDHGALTGLGDDDHPQYDTAGVFQDAVLDIDPASGLGTVKGDPVADLGIATRRSSTAAAAAAVAAR